MSMDITASVTCARCGDTYSRRKGFFHVSYSPNNKGIGYMSVCKDCVKSIYQQYLEECGDERHAMRQVCRKFDLYWSDKVFDSAFLKSGLANIATRYCVVLNQNSYVGKCYDDTLKEEGALWSFVYIAAEETEHSDDDKPDAADESIKLEQQDDDLPVTLEEDNIDITDDIVRFWGSGYPKSMYRSLEQRRRYWMARLPDGIEMDIGTEALIRQICSLELDINRDRMEGKSIEKSVNALNNLLGSANLKPTQKKDDNDADFEKTPMGVWLFRYEQKRPLPEIDEDMKDVNGVRKYVFTWMGHLCKMLGKKNAYSKLYEDELRRLRVEMPEYNDEDDEEFLMDVMEDAEEE